jgi:hypothetical protein
MSKLPLISALIFVTTILAGDAFASPTTVAAERPRSSIESSIRADLGKRTGTRFNALLEQWHRAHGTAAVPALLTIAADRKLSDSDRYIAVLATARLGGAATAKNLSSYLSDHSWMVRTAALRALTALKDPATSAEVLKLLRDPALVVRNEAVVAAQTLRPTGTIDALIAATHDEKNYHRGKAQWVPQNALDALVKIGAPGNVAHRLLALLDRKSDEGLVKKTLQTLETLTGIKTAVGVPVAEQIRRWKTKLKRTTSSEV